MTITIESLQDKIDDLGESIMGRGAGPRAQRKFRLFLGVVGIIAANVWIGPVIGHGIAALLGAGFFFIVGLGGRDSQEGYK